MVRIEVAIMRHMADNEFIDYCLKFETDPKIVRLAKIMDNMPGQIINSLKDAGMDPETCTFENIYDAGEYIRHLEDRIDYLNHELSDTQDKLADREALTVSELINELRDIAMGANRRAEMYLDDRNRANEQRKEMQHKLDMWAILNR